MEQVVKVTIEKAPEEIIVRNDKGAEWRFGYKNIDSSLVAAVTTIATSMLNATLTVGIHHTFKVNDTISYTLIMSDH